MLGGNGCRFRVYLIDRRKVGIQGPHGNGMTTGRQAHNIFLIDFP
jgi:hypothetical protein